MLKYIKKMFKIDILAMITVFFALDITLRSQKFFNNIENNKTFQTFYNVCFSPAILKNKAMGDKIKYIPTIDKQNYL